ARDLRERDDLADIRLAGKQRDEAFDTHREASVWRRAHCKRLQQVAELLSRLALAHTHRAKDRGLQLGVVDPERARTELPAVPDEVVVLAQRASRIVFDAFFGLGERRSEWMVHEGPATGLLIGLEGLDAEPPEHRVGRLAGEAALPAEVLPQAAEDALDGLLVACRKENRRARSRGERGELLPRQELRDRRAHLAVMLGDQVRES